MKKLTTIFLAAMIIVTLIGCGNKDSNGGNQGGQSKYAESLDVLKEVIKVYKEDQLFAMYGGNQENAVMDEPGKFDISKTEELDVTLGLPQSQTSNIEDAASMVHMMNANVFTGAAYRLKTGINMNDFADAVKSNILAKQWMCGQPDTLIIINVDGRYVITAYGEAEIMQIFKTNALSALSGAQVLTETPIV